MRTLTPAALQSMLAESSGCAHLAALVVYDPRTPGAPVRLVANTQDIVLGGYTYTSAGFELRLAVDSEDQVPQVRIGFDNTSLELVEFLRSVSTPTPIDVLSLLVEPDGTVSIELGPIPNHLMSISMNQETVEAVLGFDSDILNLPAVQDTFSPNIAPGLT